MKQFCNKDSVNLVNAKWELKTNSINESKMSKTKYNNFLEQKQRFLDLRRKRLFELYIKEDWENKQELESNHETPEQVLKKMEEKLIRLKEEKEKERMQIVKASFKKKFYRAADELRKNDSDAFALKCYMEQENQMLDKLQVRQMEKKEEEIFDKLMQLEIKKNYEKEMEMERERKLQQDKALKMLEWQRQNIESRQKEEKELLEYEKAKLRELWSKELLLEKQKKGKEREEILNQFHEIEEFNKREMEVKKAILEQEKQNDKELIKNILDKEKALDEIDKKEKEKRKIEFTENKKYLDFVLHKRKADLAAFDKIAQIEAEKQWQKTQEVWMREEQARIDLLRSVYKEREEAIKLKRQEKTNLEKEREFIDIEMKKYINEVKRIKEEEKLKKHKHQEDLKYQIELKERAKLTEKQNKLYDERAAQLWEAEYQKKINEQRQIQMQRIKEIKRRGYSEAD